MEIVVVGSSAAALSAIEHFRRHDPHSRITLITKDQGLPYSRVLLPYVLRGSVPYENLTIRDEGFFERLGVRQVCGAVCGLEREKRRVWLEDGACVPYDRLLIASGARASVPHIPGIEHDRVCYMRTREDLDHMLPLLEGRPRVAVIGSGFVALQAAWAARYRGLDVTILGHRIMPVAIDEAGGAQVARAIERCGVRLLAPVDTRRIESRPDGSLRLWWNEKDFVEADVVLAGAGTRPNVEWLTGSGIPVEKGVLVNERMQTSDPLIYAPGDAAPGPSVFGEAHVIHALWPTAVEMGRVAGCQMAGVDMPYPGSLNMNVTQMFEVTVASIGNIRSRDTDGWYSMPEELGYGHCRVFVRDGRLCGASLVGSSEGVPLLGRLRPLIARREPFAGPVEELGRLVNKRAFSKALSGM